MQHVVTQTLPPVTVCDGAGRVHLVPVWQDNLVWILECVATGEAAVIDGPEVAPVQARITALGLNWTTLINTHTHPDHIGINRQLAKQGRLDALRVIGNPDQAIPGLNTPVREGDRVQVGRLSGQVMLTEGHQDGHLSYLFGDALFCGDVLFGAGCGYLFDGPPAKMHASLQRLAALPPQTHVFCAHEYTQDNLRFAWSIDADNPALAARITTAWAVRGAGGCTIPSSIAVERATNPFLRGDGVRDAVAKAMPEADLSSPAQIFAATRALKDRKDYKQQPDTDLPLEAALNSST